MKDYKKTLNLPRTDFPMKAALPRNEPAMLAEWDKQDIYGLIRKALKGHPRKILHDGPPYANGNIHMGHVLNKTLKDIVIKYWTMKGFDSSYVPGWDCHGLPIEHQLLKELRMRKHQVPQVEFRRKAHEYAMKYVQVQRGQFKRLGIFGDWDNPYLTLSREYEETIVRSFGALVEKGYVYRGLKPVNWCPDCETALAEAEVEYEDHVSPSVSVKFALEKNDLFPDNTALVIWTTTPWTLIANVAVAAHPEYTYVLVKTSGGHLVLAEDLCESVCAGAGYQDVQVLRKCKGKDMEGLTYAHPLGLRQGKVVLADYVSRAEGTGLVHTAPGHGNEDFLTGLRYGLPVIMPVDSRGRFDDTCERVRGEPVFQANARIIELLEECGALVSSEELRHSYPHCWRCKKPVIFRATNQWFLNLGHLDLRARLVKAVDEEVSWTPAAGRERIRAMVEMRPDWCLSRQRHWGVPIPSLICEDCSDEFLAPSVITRFADYVRQEGSDCWFKRDVADFAAGDVTCPRCGGRRLRKGIDILDVWFDSGVSHQAVVKKRPELGDLPCELYLEGSDQHRGWFQSSLIPSLCLDGRAPFRKVLTHGFVVDGSGRKMSKSLGNVVSPLDILKDYGADILRLWVASSDYNEDIRVSKEILTRLSEAYRKIRNTARFMLSNLYDFNPDTDRVAYSDLRCVDRWILGRLYTGLIPAMETGFGGDEQGGGEFEFYRAYRALYDFCNQSLSMDYLDMVKGRLYTYGRSSVPRRAAQTALYELLSALVRLMAPILPFTAEEIWRYMPRSRQEREVASVHLLRWPPGSQEFTEEAAGSSLGDILRLKPDVARMLEELRANGSIGSSFDAGIILLTNNRNRYNYLNGFKHALPEIFKVSQVRIHKVEDQLDKGEISTAYADVALVVRKAAGNKCPRCWNYYESLEESGGEVPVCGNCLKAIEEVEST